MNGDAHDVEGSGDDVQESQFVLGLHLNDRVEVGNVVVQGHLGFDPYHLFPLGYISAFPGLDELVQIRFPFEDGFHLPVYLLPELLVGDRPEVDIVYVDDIHVVTVLPWKDPGREDVEPVGGDDPHHLGKVSHLLFLGDGDLGVPRIVVVVSLYGQAFLSGPFYEEEVFCHPFRGDLEEVPVGKLAELLFYFLQGDFALEVDVDFPGYHGEGLFIHLGSQGHALFQDFPGF